MIRTIVLGEQLILPEGKVKNCGLVIENGHIVDILPKHQLSLNAQSDVVRAKIVCPGLVDTHIHGAAGSDTMDATPEALHTIGTYLVTCGTTTWQATTVTDTLEKTRRAIVNATSYPSKAGEARLRGIFLEGLYITAEHRGAHPVELIREIDCAEIATWQELGVKTIIIAPEKEHAIEAIKKFSPYMHISLGHSSADYPTAMAAIAAGADAGVHTFCGMSPLHHRNPNLLGAILTEDAVYAELIADGIHVQKPAMDLLFRAKPRDKVILVSDAICGTGLPDGKYVLGTLPVTIKNGVARTESGSLAGSTTNLLASVRRLIREVGIAPHEAINMASLNPCQRFGWQDIGSLEVGKWADFLCLDADYQLQATYIAGKKVYERKEK